jgi:hypothetical protein
MDYKGFGYQLVRTSHPTGLKWTVEIQANGRVGSCYSRAAATALAQITIDKLVEESPGSDSIRFSPPANSQPQDHGPSRPLVHAGGSKYEQDLFLRTPKYGKKNEIGRGIVGQRRSM